MARILFILILLTALTLPGQAHAFGIFNYFFSAVANNLGVSRGPVPKKVEFDKRAEWAPCPTSQPRHLSTPNPNLQAEGY